MKNNFCKILVPFCWIDFLFLSDHRLVDGFIDWSEYSILSLQERIVSDCHTKKKKPLKTLFSVSQSFARKSFRSIFSPVVELFHFVNINEMKILEDRYYAARFVPLA